jgi:hypothetical protein
MTTLGFGHHQIFIPASKIVPSLLMAFIARLTYQFVLFIVKLGMCVFYLRVFQDRTSKIIIYSIMGFLIGTFIPVQLLTVFGARPLLMHGAFISRTVCLGIQRSISMQLVTSSLILV